MPAEEVLITRPSGRAAGTLLCLPGTMSAPAIFDGLADRTGADVVIAPWLAWPGPHDMATLGARVAELVVEHAPVVLVGHSTGGVIALRAALHRMHGLAGLVLSDTGANMRGHGDVDAIIEHVRAAWGPELWRAVAQRGVHLPVPERIADALETYPATLRRSAVIDALTSQRDTDLAPLLGELDLPALVVHGRYDRARELRHATELAELLGAPAPVVLECGHTPAAECPESFAAQVRRFLANLD